MCKTPSKVTHTLIHFTGQWTGAQDSPGLPVNHCVDLGKEALPLFPLLPLIYLVCKVGPSCTVYVQCLAYVKGKGLRLRDRIEINCFTMD